MLDYYMLHLQSHEICFILASASFLIVIVLKALTFVSFICEHIFLEVRH